MEFKEEMVTKMIPAIERMIQKEEDHLKYLKESREKMIKMSNRFFGLFNFIHEKDFELVEEWIIRSKNNLNYYCNEYFENYLKIMNVFGSTL